METSNVAEIQSLDMLPRGSRIYFIGIGGISMSGLALMAKGFGFEVGGSDMHLSERTRMLEEKGIKVFDKQCRESIELFGADYVVKTAAILPKNPEVAYALENELPIFDRSEFLGLITRSYSKVINVAGTHGKTTTTAMLSMMMIEAEIDPTVHLGAELDAFGGTIRMGADRKMLVSEACEFKRSFLEFRSTTAAITNVDHDHVDCYPTLEDVIDVFAKFIDKLVPGGNVVVTGRDKNLAKSISLAKDSGNEFNLYACVVEGDNIAANDFDNLEVSGVIEACNVNFDKGTPCFDVKWLGNIVGHVELLIPGKHNVDNSLIALASALLNGVPADKAISALNKFTGADGRYEVKGKYKGATVVADYAHHPAAAVATIDAASHMPHNKMWVVFQPLTFNRTKMLFEEYVEALKNCPKVIFDEIFTDREVDTLGVSSKHIADRINSEGGDAEFYDDKQKIIDRLDELVSEGDLVLILGPEDIRELGDVLVKL